MKLEVKNSTNLPVTGRASESFFLNFEPLALAGALFLMKQPGQQIITT